MPANSPTGARLWMFRIAALLVVPLVLLLVIEIVLRIAGFGYPTDFLLKSEVEKHPRWVENQRFGWRFFGPKYARTPEILSLSPEAAADTIRVFVMGESAAYGDPNKGAGLPRMIEAMLSLRYPATRFEVVNVAMTAINSHVIRDIASACAKADGDVWVLYMGNNEVVGPYGSGTIFGSQTPPLSVIRANLALKTTRTGQLLDVIGGAARAAKADAPEWKGMSMFLDQQVAADDPRMERVYAFYQKNLEDIIACGRRSGAKVVVSNVAVSLRDCAPFGSRAIADLNPKDAAGWERLMTEGIRLQEQEKWAEALAVYQKAAEIEYRNADLHFRMGRCALGLGDAAKASAAFGRARDLDTLRFRCDSRMQRIVQQVAARHKGADVRFADAVSAFAAASPDDIPGKEFFYEHVHLTWEGNWLLAKTIADEIVGFLPDSVRRQEGALPEWPSSAQCARRLAWTDLEKLGCLKEMRKRMHEPPFTRQLNHAEQTGHLDAEIQRIESKASASDMKAELAAVDQALQTMPDDYHLLTRRSDLCVQTGDPDAAITAARRMTVLLPHASKIWSQLGSILIKTGKPGEAADAFQRALRINPNDNWARHQLAEAYVRDRKYDEAIQAWEQVLKQQPWAGQAEFSIAQVLETQGKYTEAEVRYDKALQSPDFKNEDLMGISGLCMQKGLFHGALACLEKAAEASPADARVHYALSAVLGKLGRKDEAARKMETARANDADGGIWKARFQSGIEHAQHGRLKEAVDDFREVVRMNPGLAQAHFNLASGLLELGLKDEAALEFKETRRLNPTDPRILARLKALGY